MSTKCRLFEKCGYELVTFHFRNVFVSHSSSSVESPNIAIIALLANVSLLIDWHCNQITRTNFILNKTTSLLEPSLKLPQSLLLQSTFISGIVLSNFCSMMVINSDHVSILSARVININRLSRAYYFSIRWNQFTTKSKLPTVVN